MLAALGFMQRFVKFDPGLCTRGLGGETLD